MNYDRKALKERAKALVKSSDPSIKKTTVFYLLIVFAAELVVSVPYLGAIGKLSPGMSEQAALSIIGGNIGGSGLLGLAANLCTIVLSYGYINCCLHAARGEAAESKLLFSGFALFGRCIGSSLLVGLYIFLWSILGFLPATAVLIYGVVQESSGLIAAGVILYLAGAAWAVIVSLRYAMTAFLVMDEGGRTTSEAIRESKELMKGNKGRLFVLRLSFIGWYLLSILTMYVAAFLVMVPIIISMGELSEAALMASLPLMIGLTTLAMIVVTLLWYCWLLSYIGVATAEFYLYAQAENGASRALPEAEEPQSLI